ncbi:MAG: tripartite tricarboxylate transporter substrate binding protein [Betaproteobacteria bacterium]|nr:tripartite tricarboxylate transporter substrate binding protein [Betaproteobacteria bacterium]
MHTARRIAARTLSATVLALACSAGAHAQGFPNKQIELILPAAPGGTTDTAVRLMTGKWQEFLGQPVVVVNVPGAGGVIGANQVAKAKPDGYTLMGAFDSLVVALPFVQKTVEYNMDSFSYLNGFGMGAIYITARADSPYKNMADVIDAAKKANGKLSYASYGIGVITHFTAERLWDLTGVKLTYVPYKSSPESVSAMLGGHVDFAVTAGTGGAARNPQARILAVAGDQRRPDTPSIPTLKEQGYPVSLDFISAVLAPRGLPEDVRARLVDAIQKAVAKYGDLFREEFPKKADLLFINMPGEQVQKTWKERQNWFRETAPKMNLDKR